VSARAKRIAIWGTIAIVGAILAAGAPGQGSGRLARSIEFDGSVNPASAAWVERALDDAAEDGAELAMIRLDTPGGLDTSTREIVQDVLSAPLPVIVYVYPDGGRAASAGVFITQAGDVAAMAPQTNIGSATPITIGPGEQDEVLGRKVANDAAAYARALAEGHGRNGNLAAEMVTDAVNVTAREALQRNAIDAISATPEELLSDLDGFRVKGPKAQALETEGLRIETRDTPLRYELLGIIVEPTIAYLLLLAGVLGIMIEAFNPGTIIPGAFGLVSLLLGLYGTAQLPVRLTGILLLVLAAGLIVAEAHVAAGGILGAAGVAALIASGLLLYDTDSDAFEVSEPVVIAAGLVVGGFLAFAVERVFRVHRDEPVRTGWEELVGREAEVRSPLDPIGQVFLEGALWRARASGDEPIAAGNRVRVESVDGLTLEVGPVVGGPSETP